MSIMNGIGSGGAGGTGGMMKVKSCGVVNPGETVNLTGPGVAGMTVDPYSVNNYTITIDGVDVRNAVNCFIAAKYSDQYYVFPFKESGKFKQPNLAMYYVLYE